MEQLLWSGGSAPAGQASCHQGRGQDIAVAQPFTRPESFLEVRVRRIWCLLPPGSGGKVGQPHNHTVTTFTAKRAGVLEPAGASRLRLSGVRRAVRCSGSPGGHSGAQSTRTNGATSVRIPVGLLCPRLVGFPRWPGCGDRSRDGDTRSSPLGLPGNYALGANINKGSRKGVLIPDLTTRLLHMREISGPRNCLHPSPFVSKQSAAFINSDWIFPGWRWGEQGGEGVGRRGAR